MNVKSRPPERLGADAGCQLAGHSEPSISHAGSIPSDPGTHFVLSMLITNLSAHQRAFVSVSFNRHEAL